MSTQLNLTNPGQKELAGSISALFIERFLGVVDGTLERKSFFKNFAEIQQVIGTNVISKKRIGKSTISGVQPGSSPQGEKTAFSNKSLTIDTIILSRAVVYELDSIQNDFNELQKIGEEQGKEHAKIYDQAFLIQLLKGAAAAAPSIAGWSAGTDIAMDGAGDEDDPDKVVDKLLSLVSQMEEKDVDLEDMVLFMKPTLKATLLKAAFLAKKDMAGDASVQEYELEKLAGLRVVVTNNMPVEDASFVLDEINGGSSFAIDATEAKVIALIGTKRSFLAGESKSLTSRIHEDPMTFATYVDSYRAFNVTYDRPSECGSLSKA